MPRRSIGTRFKKITAVGTQTARGGQNVEVTATDGSHYMVSLAYTSNTLATNTAEGANGQGRSLVGRGGCRASRHAERQLPAADRHGPGLPDVGRARGDHRRRLDPEHRADHQPAGTAPEEGLRTQFRLRRVEPRPRLNVGQITINSGQIGAILGFQDTELSGPLVSNGTGCDRPDRACSRSCPAVRSQPAAT